MQKLLFEPHIRDSIIAGLGLKFAWTMSFGSSDSRRVPLFVFRPLQLDDATIDRVERVYGEQRDFVEICAEELRLWRGSARSAEQRRELNRLEEQNRRLRQLTKDVLALARELREGTIERIMAMSDFELGLRSLLGKLPRG